MVDGKNKCSIILYSTLISRPVNTRVSVCTVKIHEYLILFMLHIKLNGKTAGFMYCLVCPTKEHENALRTKSLKKY